MSVVVITGASRGIGLATTSFLLKTFEAAVIAISRTRSSELNALSNEHPETLQIIQCDRTDELAFTNAIESAPAKYGRLDALILNAATLDPLTRIGSTDAPLDAWRAHFEVNVYSLVTALKAATPSLRESPNGGKVIFVSSGAAAGGIAGWGPYNASKAAMNSLNRTYATEEKGRIVSIAVRPGKVDTSMQGEIRERGGVHMAPDVHELFIREKKDGQLVRPEDPGHVIAALAVNGPRSLSGEFVSWDDERCREFRRPA
ncbi:short-chain dehydrogenase [Russula earlei]|uniref:Short-chain dehydrogenase n=1 Tax=Russula earlei TaxID=71964 RepID=A0ACC0TWR9_9AGAM|nr:short-chain dehydrogenase [Russula earlei]